MDFGSLPPEINSARIYSGPGSGPMLTAAEAWGQLAAELHATAASYSSVVADLTSGPWAGPAALSMAAAATPYLSWLTVTAGQAGQAAGQAGAAAAAFETAFAATVPPPLIAANRSLLASLVATNVLGQNTPAIAATEAHYGEMWAQDAAAMYGYAAASSAATQVTPFSPPPQTTEQAGLAAQAVAAQQTGADLQPVLAATPQALQGLASPAATVATSGSSEASSGSALSSMSSISSLMMPARMAMMPMSMLMRMFMMGGATGASKAATGLATTTGAGAAGSAGLTSIVSSKPAAAVSMGAATSIGGLTVPTAWTGAASATTPAAAALSAAGAGAVPSAGAGAAAMPPMMPITNLAGRGGVGGSAAQYDFRPTVLAHSPIGG